MQCVEFETRLNDLLDDRHSPGLDGLLTEHADHCSSCAELLACHESLLEGVQAMPKVRLSYDGRRAFSEKVLLAVAPFPGDSLPGPVPAELVERSSATATSRSSSWALLGLALAAAAAILIAVLPWFNADQQSVTPNQPPSQFAGADSRRTDDVTPVPTPWDGQGELAPIAWVGFQVADGLKPVTSSMVSALRELRKRPFFRGDDASGRSSFYIPRVENELLA